MNNCSMEYYDLQFIFYFDFIGLFGGGIAVALVLVLIHNDD